MYKAEQYGIVYKLASFYDFPPSHGMALDRQEEMFLNLCVHEKKTPMQCTN